MSVFISYSSEDTEFVEHLAQDLKQAGVPVWLDRLEIKPGDSIVDAVESALESSRFLLLVLSEASAGSPWVSHEWKTWMHLQMDEERRAHQESKELRRTLIPLVVDDAPIPTFLRDTKYLRVTANSPGYQDGLVRLLTVLREDTQAPPDLSHPPTPRINTACEIKLASNLLRGLIDSQFETLLTDLDPKGYVGSAQKGADPVEERARRAYCLIDLMAQKGPLWVVALQEAILSVRSPFSPFDGSILKNWSDHSSSCWQVANSQILGAGQDRLAFPHPDAPTDLQCMSLLTWEGLRFRDGHVTARVWSPMIARSGGGGLVLRKEKEQMALLCLLRQVPEDHRLALELWQRQGEYLRRLRSVECPPDLLREGWCRLTFEVKGDCVSASAASISHEVERGSSFAVMVSPGQGPGHFGFVKFGHASVAFADLDLTVHTRRNAVR